MPDPTTMDRAAFVPPGYGSLLYAHLYEDNSCPYAFPTSVLKAFRAWVLESLGLPLHAPAADLRRPVQVRCLLLLSLHNMLHALTHASP